MDDQTMTPQTAGTGRMRKYGPGVALVAAGLIGGAVLAGTAAASATETSPTPSQSANGYSIAPPQGDQNGSDANGQKGSRPQETPLTGDTADKVKAAVLAKYPDATIDRLETDSDGVYEAHITKADGTRVTVEVDKSYAVTGEEAHPAGGMGHGPDGDGPQGTDGTAPSGAPSASTTSTTSA